MKPSGPHPELSLTIPAASDAVPINGRCTLKKDGVLRVVYVAGLPAYHWADGDRMAEAHAMVSLVRCGYADQNEVARAFDCSTRTLRRSTRRFEAGGMSSLGREAGRPRGTRCATSAWASTAKSLKAQGLSVRDVAQKLGVSKSTAGRWTTKEPVVAADHRELADAAHGCDPDPDARVIDRILARMGKLGDAKPIFASGRRITHAGVLLAVPALMQSGVLTVAEEVYGHIGPAFYGLRTTMMALLLMVLLRIKRPEELKERAPADLGRVLGLDRAPEVKTLRRKLSRLALAGKAEAFGRKLAQRRVAGRGRALGFLYTDGHVRVYHGKRRLPKAYVTRMRLALPATTDYWVNDKYGDPLFVVTTELNEGLAQMLPMLTAEIRELVGPRRRITMVFDRGGWSPKLFKRLIDSGFDILTYRKGRWKPLPSTQFATCAAKVDGRSVRYELNDRNIRLLNGRLRLRQITRLREGKYQTPIVTSRRDLSAAVLAYRMFERWRQENFFKYLRMEFALDALTDYAAEPMALEQTVPNPERRNAERALAEARAELREIHTLYGEAAAANEEDQRPTMRGFKIAHGNIGKRIRAVEGRIALLKQRRRQAPARVSVAELDGEPLMRLSRERKHLTNCIKMVAYQAESDLLALLRPHYARADDEGRTLITTALQSPADLEVRDGELCVTLAPLSSAHRDQALASLCDALNEMNVRFPGTDLRMRFGAAS
jgi:transposase